MTDTREFAVGAIAGVAIAVGAVLAYQRRERSRSREPKRGGLTRKREVTRDPSYLQGQRPADAAEQQRREQAVKAWHRAKDDVLVQFKHKYPAGFGSELVLLNQIKVDNVFLLPVPHLSEYHEGAELPNRMGIGRQASKDSFSQQPYNKLMGDQDVIIHDIVRKPNADPVTTAYLRAGPRDVLHFDPSKVRAAIVSAGGLCPGLNNVIQGLVRTLISLYGVDKVYGIRGGYQGFSDPNFPPMELTLANVVGLQNKGGTIIGAPRGAQLPHLRCHARCHACPAPHHVLLLPRTPAAMRAPACSLLTRLPPNATNARCARMARQARAAARSTWTRRSASSSRTASTSCEPHRTQPLLAQLGFPFACLLVSELFRNCSRTGE